MEMVRLENLHFQYPGETFSLRIPGLTINKKEKVGLIGPSGCGKTTLANLIAGIYRPISGDITVNGQTVSKLSDSRCRDFRISNIGFIFQEFELIEYLNVHENILLPFLVNRSLKLDSAVRREAALLADSVGLGDKLPRRPGELSQGERQRLAICRALITRPPIIIADEPTGNLDPVNTDIIMKLILHQIEEREATFLMVSHDHSLLEDFDQVVDVHELASGSVT
jgi:putative ABC transport system ATP-binding protein